MLLMRCVLYLINLVVIASLFAVHAKAAVPLPASPPLETQLISETDSRSTYEKFKEKVGITYFTYVYGPGVHEDTYKYCPNQLGKGQNDGIYLQSQVSVRYKFDSNLALDFQSRFNTFLNDGRPQPTDGSSLSEFKVFRWETPRIGISGKLISGEDWTLSGAINTDFPYVLPAPFSGYQARQRTVLFTPGMFATLKYQPKHSRWQIFSVVSPRYFLYEDRNAADPQLNVQGLSPGNKPEFILAFQPTINYRIGEKTKISAGTSIDYRKHVLSDWNPFHASLLSNGDDPAWRLSPVPLSVGVTYEVASYLTVFPFISTYPIAAQRVNANDGSQASLLKTTSIGMWVYGTIF